MFQDKTILAIIPARAGSKGIRDKNIVPLAGKPLIVWTIEAALAAEGVDRVIVTTDSERIASAAREAGADVPFLRPSEFATDEASSEDVIRHAAGWVKENENRRYDYILLLQPTSPLRTSAHIHRALEDYFTRKKTKNDTLISVSSVPPKFRWIAVQNEQGYLVPAFDRQQRPQRRQDLGEVFRPNGMIYFGPEGSVLRGGFQSGNALPFVTGEEESLDIDTPEELREAESRMNIRNAAFQQK